jgi:hypothetical protein
MLLAPSGEEAMILTSLTQSRENDRQPTDRYLNYEKTCGSEKIGPVVDGISAEVEPILRNFQIVTLVLGSLPEVSWSTCKLSKRLIEKWRDAVVMTTIATARQP